MDWLWLMSKVILQTVGIIKNKIKIHSTWNQTNVQNITFDLDNMMTSSNGNMFRATRYAWTNVWANNRNAGDLRWHRAHYDVTVVWYFAECVVYSTWYACGLVVFCSAMHTLYWDSFTHILQRRFTSPGKTTCLPCWKRRSREVHRQS